MKAISPFKKSYPGLASGAIALIALVAILVIGGFSLMGGYNKLVTLDSEVEMRAANIESQLKRRADLVPNLVSTVKGYAKHEQTVFDNIAAARSRLLAADVNQNPQEAAAANSAFNSSLGRLMAIAENYPQLKANQNFIGLQDELTGTENRLNLARIEFNDAVKNYNLTVRTFPSNIIAGITGFERKAPFEAAEADRATPQVAF